MVSIQGRTTDALVTPNHKMLMLNENNVSRECAKTEFEVIGAGSLPSRFALPASARVEDRPDIPEFVLPGHSWECGMGLERRVPAVCDRFKPQGWGWPTRPAWGNFDVGGWK